MNDIISVKILVEGIVQGVGFRPFVYNLAHQNNISGYVLNNSNGVEIEATGNKHNIDEFILEIKEKPPRLSVITSFNYSFVKKSYNYNDSDFVIKESVITEERRTLISPDISICDKCRDELFDPNNRRYYYPFINLTDCGPRYTIIENIPYDRKFTSMKNFIMCPECREEYENPSDRRFHAQPNACFICGPQLSLIRNDGTDLFTECDMTPTISTTEEILLRRQRTEKIIESVIGYLKNGNIVAIKGIGGFHLAVNAEDDDAVARLRKRKTRYEKPFALMSLNHERILQYADIIPEDKILLESIQKPIVLLKKREGNSFSKNIAPSNDCFGVMLPYTPLHYLLLKENFLALIMTSGNQSDEPICINEEDAFQRLEGIADYFLFHNRPIYLRCDDSVIRNIYTGFSTEQVIRTESHRNKNEFSSRIIMRRSRGYIPTPIFLNVKLPVVMALGAELKNTICFGKDDRAFISQHIGDLSNIETLDYFEESIEHLKNILQFDPEIIAYDFHPEYLNTKWLHEKDISSEKEIIGVQHHHAHIVSCMAENMIDDQVIGFAMDGTGFGIDGNIWGGEILISDLVFFERYSHFEYLPLPGGDIAIREPWRMGIDFLYKHYGEKFKDIALPFLRNTDIHKSLAVSQMIKKNINTYQTSSLGRLFDAVAAISAEIRDATYEGQGAIKFENFLYQSKENYNSEQYDFYLDSSNIIQTDKLAEQVINDIQKEISLHRMSYKFHNGVVKILSSIAQKIRDEKNINKVVMSGGCFQNNFLVFYLVRELKDLNFEVFTHRLVPPNDGGISLGQAVNAGMRYRLK